MCRLVVAILTATLVVACAPPPPSTRPAVTTPATTFQATVAPPTPTATPTPTPSPTPTPKPIEETACADLDGFLDRTRPARIAAAGPVARPAAAPTVPPPNTTPPPLGQYLLAESPMTPFTEGSGGGFLRTSQDIFGPDAWGQSPALAAQNGLLWVYARQFLAGTRVPGGLLLYVYEFWSVDGALAFDEGVTRTACLYGGSVFEIPEIPQAIGQRFRNGSQYALRATFVLGKRRYVVMLTTAGSMPAEDIAHVARFAVAVAR